MSFIYDILINFNKQLVDFYDWNLNDNIEHVRKMPLYRIDSKSLLDIKDHVVMVDSTFLERIRHKTEIFHNHNVSKIQYACLFSDGAYVLGIKFNSKGVSVGKSKMLLDEEMEVLDVCERLKEDVISYEVLMDDVVCEFSTREELKIKKYLLSEIRKNHNHDKLKFIYFDCYGEQEDDVSKIVDCLTLSIQENSGEVIDQLYRFFKLTSAYK